MNQAHVDSAVAAWWPVLNLPPSPAAGAKDLQGRSIRVARFADEDAVRFFFPKRSLIFQQRMVKVMTRALRKRGAKIETVQLVAADYERWLRTQGEPDSPELRYRFASAPPKF